MASNMTKKGRKLPSKAWWSVTIISVVFLLVANILLNTWLYPLICQVLGRERAILAEGTEANLFVKDFETKEEARLNADAINEKVVEEGMILLKNNDNVLPIATPVSDSSVSAKPKISVFGKNSVNMVTAGSGSAAGNTDNVKWLDTALETAGYEINPTLWDFYKKNSLSGNGRSPSPDLTTAGSAKLYTGETPYSRYTEQVIDSYSEYNDAAIIVISRLGGESWDLPRSMKDMEGAREQDDHYLQLDANETELIQQVCAAGFDKVIVLINAATTFELGFLDDPTHYAYNANIDACLWVGHPGDSGLMALGRILNGQVNPSGKTVDIFARNFKNDPTWQNFGDNFTSQGGRYTSVPDKKNGYVYAFVDYEESIYMGYRYYETRALTEEAAWYNQQVTYPFGYGLSYTTFSHEIVNKAALGSSMDGKTELKVEVQVTNTGSVKGKDAVEVFVTAPYTNGGIEKAHVVLAGFAKTADIEPGKSQKVEVTLELYDFASYDYNDANNNGFKGYELEAGDYVIKAMKNSHTLYDSVTLNLSSGIQYDKDPVTGTEVKNLYEDADDELGTILSRTDWNGTFPVTRTEEERALSATTNEAINSVAHNNPNEFKTRPTMGAEGERDEEGNKIYTFKSLAGLDPWDNGAGEEAWNKVLDQITFDEMKNLINLGAFKTSAIESIDKAATVDADGPAGFADFMGGESLTAPVYGVCHYCCEPLMAATFNVDLLFAVGEAVGNEALCGNERGDGMPYSGWYAPGMNIHRSPFGGRAGEYFSEDPFLSGMLGAYEIKGAMTKGVYTQVKHFAVNEQETNRTGVCTWLTEQSLREIYLKPFEKAVKIGGTRGMMSSFNRIGAKWTGGDYRLLTTILRDEWGFKGMVISDYNAGTPFMNCAQQAYAGGDLGLNAVTTSWAPKKSSTADLNIMRQCTLNILYTTVNSNLVSVEVLGYLLPIWQIGLFVFDGVAAVLLALWGVLSANKPKKAKKEANA